MSEATTTTTSSAPTRGGFGPNRGGLAGRGGRGGRGRGGDSASSEGRGSGRGQATIWRGSEASRGRGGRGDRGGRGGGRGEGGRGNTEVPWYKQFKNDTSNQSRSAAKKRTNPDGSQAGKKKFKSRKPKKTTPQKDPTDILKYLQDWQGKPESDWKFNKNSQSWLLKNVYTKAKVDKDMFKLALEYIKTINGLGKVNAAADAREMVKSLTEQITKSEEKEAEAAADDSEDKPEPDTPAEAEADDSKPSDDGDDGDKDTDTTATTTTPETTTETAVEITTQLRNKLRRAKKVLIALS